MASIALYPVQRGPKKWILAVVAENRPGYTPSKYAEYPDEETAWKVADWHNSDMGILDRRRVLEVVGSSIAAQDMRDGTNLLGGEQ